MFSKLKTKLQKLHEIPGVSPSSRSQSQSQAQQPLQPPTQSTDLNTQNNTFNPLAAGIDLSRRTFTYFYNTTHHQFCSPYSEPGTIDSQHGYVVWPVSIGFWCIADAYQRSKNKEDVRDLDLAFAAMEKHWNGEMQGYCAWLMYPGNKDVYYDDNAHCGNALVSAFEATGESKYIEKARLIVMGLMARGWDREGKGGVAWHVDKYGSRNACSTLSASMLACRLALHGVEKEYCTEFARSCIRFSMTNLLAQDDGLVLDAIHLQGDGSWKHDARKFTYNTGFAIQSFQLWYQLTGAEEYKERAAKLALVAIEPNSVLMQKAISNPDERVWLDEVFFAHHLVEALVLVAKNQPGTEAATKITAFLSRLAGYLRGYIFDASDQMYFQNLRMANIDEERRQRFNEVFKASKTLTAAAGERENGPGPVEGRRLIKTLIGNASVARIYLCISDLLGDVPLPRQS